MNDKELLECCQGVLEFLTEDDFKLHQSGGYRLRHQLTLPTPKQKIMDEILTRNNWGNGGGGADMIGFTEFLNDKFQMGFKWKRYE